MGKYGEWYNQLSNEVIDILNCARQFFNSYDEYGNENIMQRGNYAVFEASLLLSIILSSNNKITEILNSKKDYKFVNILKEIYKINTVPDDKGHIPVKHKNNYDKSVDLNFLLYAEELFVKFFSKMLDNDSDLSKIEPIHLFSVYFIMDDNLYIDIFKSIYNDEEIENIDTKCTSILWNLKINNHSFHEVHQVYDDYVNAKKIFSNDKDNSHSQVKNDYLSNPSIGREKELYNLMTSLLIPKKGVIIVGPSGVGKTALVNGLDYAIKNGDVPAYFKDYKIVSTPSSEFVGGCQFVGMVEEKVKNIVEKIIKENEKVILFIDEIHQTIGAGTGSKSNIDVSSLLQPYIDSGQIKLIGCTTDEEYTKYVEENKPFKRRFEKVTLKESDKELTMKILEGTIPALEQVMGISFDSNILESAVNYIAASTEKKNRVYDDKTNNPDLALSIVKKAFALAIMDNKNVVDIESVSKAISSCERLYDSVKSRIGNEMLATSESTKSVSRVLQFPKEN